jgi:acetyltransferase-like isoleucine patch superfamily enzyme
MRRLVALANWVIGLRIRRSGRVILGRGSRVSWWRLRMGSQGNRVVIGQDSIVQCRIDFDGEQGRVAIGDRSYISWGVTIVDHDSHSIFWSERSADVALWHKGQKRWDHVTIRPVVIADKVWIGFGVSILKGVIIGEGAVIGACSVVTRNVEPYSVVAGNPARVIRRLSPDTKGST